MYYFLFAMIVNIWIFGIRTTSSLELSKGLAPQFQAEFSGLQGLHQFYISLELFFWDVKRYASHQNSRFSSPMLYLSSKELM